MKPDCRELSGRLVKFPRRVAEEARYHRVLEPLILKLRR